MPTPVSVMAITGQLVAISRGTSDTDTLELGDTDDAASLAVAAAMAAAATVAVARVVAQSFCTEKKYHEGIPMRGMQFSPQCFL